MSAKKRGAGGDAPAAQRIELQWGLCTARVTRQGSLRLGIELDENSRKAEDTASAFLSRQGYVLRHIRHASGIEMAACCAELRRRGTGAFRRASEIEAARVALGRGR